MADIANEEAKEAQESSTQKKRSIDNVEGDEGSRPATDENYDDIVS